MATVTAESLLTAEEFAQRPDPGHPEELVRGRIVPLPPPSVRHGEICANVSGILRDWVKPNDLGRVVGNDSGVITERGPDTVRGADVAYYSFARLPKGPLPAVWGPAVPELVFKVLSPSDRWPKVLGKVSEYLEAGVLFVVVLDDKSRAARVFDPDGMLRLLSAEEELTLPEILGDFRVVVRQFFE